MLSKLEHRATMHFAKDRSRIVHGCFRRVRIYITLFQCQESFVRELSRSIYAQRNTRQISSSSVNTLTDLFHPVIHFRTPSNNHLTIKYIESRAIRHTHCHIEMHAFTLFATLLLPILATAAPAITLRDRQCYSQPPQNCGNGYVRNVFPSITILYLSTTTRARLHIRSHAQLKHGS